FFQAEDGIRDFHVTGVQTCALPISFPSESLFAFSPESLFAFSPESLFAFSPECFSRSSRNPVRLAPESPLCGKRVQQGRVRSSRSEERRVGKECRSWSARCR